MKSQLVLHALLSILPLALPAAAQESFGEKYASLSREQKHLVDDWVARFNRVIGKQVQPHDVYDHLPQSSRTTFDAVTHALMNTKLTNQEGSSLGTAIQIVEKVDTVRGDVAGTRGDQQFRIYVQLKAGTTQLLQQSLQFKQMADNTVFHKGYPICFRSQPFVPSIQVSISRDEKRADIDVDYRASSFPAALFNGHLSASNSDVRAGRNDKIHDRQWQGLTNWWRGLLGLPLFEFQSVSGVDTVIPKNPKVKATEKPERAIQNFLKTWLVDQKPNEALSYISERAYPCMEIERGGPLDYGVAKFNMLVGMQEINRKIGKVENLSQATRGVELSVEQVKPIRQPFEQAFRLYNIRDDLAAQLDCSNQLHPEQISAKAARSKNFNTYVGAALELQTENESGAPITMLWAREARYWKLVSYDIAAEPEEGRIPDNRARIAEGEPTYVVADPEVVKASTTFLREWLVEKEIDRAIGYLSPSCFACVDLYRSDDVPAPTTREQAAKQLRDGLERVVKRIGAVSELKDAIVAPEIDNPDLKLARHQNEKSFVIASIPDYIAEAARCSGRKRGEPLGFTGSPTDKRYGTFYAIGLRMAETGEDSAVLWIVWAKDNGSWKIASYGIITP